MARQNKKQQQSNRCSLLDAERRPVTKADKWCERKLTWGGILDGDAPWGYVVTIPYCPNKRTFLENVDGRIVRVKKHCGQLLLQVIPKDKAPNYGVKSNGVREPRASKKKRSNKKRLFRKLSIKNLCKSKGEWGKEIR